MVASRKRGAIAPYRQREAMVIVTLESDRTAYVTLPVATIQAGHGALASALAERQERGEIPAGKIVGAKPVR
jgi:hypothetical protein